MLEAVRKVNSYFKSATRAEVDNLLSQIILSERQADTFDMYYIKKKDVGFIADRLYVSISVINTELRIIRDKMIKVIYNFLYQPLI